MENKSNGRLNTTSRGILVAYLMSISAFPKKWQLYYYLNVWLTLIITILSNIGVFVNMSDKLSYIRSSVHLTQFIYYTFFGPIFLHHKRDTLMKMIDIHDSDFYVYTNFIDTVNGVDTVQKRCKSVLITYAPLMFVIWLNVMLSPLIVVLCFGADYKSAEMLSSPGWYPWLPLESKLEYVLTCFVSIWETVTTISCMIINILFTWYFIIEVEVQTERICSAFHRIKSQSMYEIFPRDEIPKDRIHLNDIEKVIYDELTVKQLRECIIHHNILIKFINCYTSAYKIVFTASLLQTVITMGQIGFIIFDPRNSMVTKGQVFVQIGICFIFLFTYCHLGEVLERANERIQNSIYDLDWYDFSVPFAKYLYVVMLRCQRGLLFRGVGSYVAGYQLFTGVTKLTYSFLNLLLKVL